MRHRVTREAVFSHCLRGHGERASELMCGPLTSLLLLEQMEHGPAAVHCKVQMDGAEGDV